MIKEIRKEKFEALSYSRVPKLGGLLEELEWYTNIQATLIGIVLFDQVDHDFSDIILGRDETGVFRAIEMLRSLELKKYARGKLKINGQSIESDKSDLFYDKLMK